MALPRVGAIFEGDSKTVGIGEGVTLRLEELVRDCGVVGFDRPPPSGVWLGCTACGYYKQVTPTGFVATALNPVGGDLFIVATSI